MSRRLKVEEEEYEEQDSWIARLRDKWFGEEVEEEEEEGFAPAPPSRHEPAAPRVNRSQKAQPNGTLLQVHAHRGSQISKRAPRTLLDAQRAAEDLKERRPVIVNLEKADDELARRVIDFISGVTYALNGFYERVGDKVFLFTPANIIIADEDEVEPGGKGLYADDDLLG
ncbi:MAG: cell division protein SepF [Armatimonadota bacterium]